MADSSFAEATIKNLTDGDTVKCLFRPKEYTFAKQNNWNASKAVGLTVKPPTFRGGNPMTLNMELFFDTYEAKSDVRNLTNGLWRMMKVTDKKKDGDTKKSEPPHVEFRWGTMWTFKAVITSLQQRFTLFLGDGTPVRSTVQVAFMQAEDDGRYPGQNPTSGGHEGYAVHIVKEGETIDWIAFSEYGSSNAWRHLADANRVDDPENLRAGQRLLIVPMD